MGAQNDLPVRIKKKKCCQRPTGEHEPTRTPQEPTPKNHRKPPPNIAQEPTRPPTSFVDQWMGVMGAAIAALIPPWYVVAPRPVHTLGPRFSTCLSYMLGDFG